MNAQFAPLTQPRFTPFCAPGGGTTESHPRVSPLQLADRILSLAQVADRAGHYAAARQLLDVMNAVLDQSR